MDLFISNIQLASPEILVLSMSCLILVLDLYLGNRDRAVIYYLSQITLIGAAVTTAIFPVETTSYLFSNTFVRDLMGDFLKITIYMVMFVVFLYSRDYLRQRQLFKGEYYVLGLFGVLGMMIMVSAHSFLSIYLGLELLSLTLYTMVAFNRNSATASEAAMKYFVLGAIASGMLLYGMSILYGITGTLDIGEIQQTLSGGTTNTTIALFGLMFVIVGIAFKFGVVPFHMWVPDIYHGAPTSVTLYLGTAPKIAAFAMAIRLLAEALPGLHSHWKDILVILATLSFASGNIIAIVQTNIKRMLAYSTIAHVGFLFLGLLAGTPEGYSAAMFYTITYALMSLGAFGMIIMLSRQGFEADSIDDFKGLNERSPWLAFMMMIFMFSLAGVPPTVGFYAKFMVLKVMVDIDMIWLAVAAVIFSIIGAYYYLRIIKVMYFDKPEDTAPVTASADTQLMMSVNGLAVLGLGLFPGTLMTLCNLAFT